jgi:hypothetical protein
MAVATATGVADADATSGVNCGVAVAGWAVGGRVGCGKTVTSAEIDGDAALAHAVKDASIAKADIARKHLPAGNITHKI